MSFATAKLSLAQLRHRAATLQSAPALRRFALELERDGRAGARFLAQRCKRRALHLDAEQRRLDQLLQHQRALHAAGARRVAGVDEVGVGSWAGPVVAAAVVLPERPQLPGLDDSKKLSRRARERLSSAVREQALAIGLGVVSCDDVDRLNVRRAGLEAMRRAVGALPEPADHLLVDAHTIPGLSTPQTPLIGGDGRAAAIAAASVVAKVHRDAIMCRLDALHPDYGFAAHKGYGTSAHRRALLCAGVSPVHRRSFAPVAELLQR